MSDKKLNWRQVCMLGKAVLEKYGLPELYHERLKYELDEIDKQGSNANWLNLINDKKRFDSNPNKLLLPWLLKMLVVRDDSDKGYRKLTEQEWLNADPIARRDEAKDGPVLTSSHYKVVKAVLESTGKIPSDIKLDSDKPDIDLDCLPIARDGIKKYAAELYNRGEMNDDERPYGYVCSVGTWQTYLFKQALIDVWKALGHSDKDQILAITTGLPDDVDELKEGGRSVCKDKVKGADGEEVECKTVHAEAKCPKCGSDATDGPTIGKLLAEYKDLAEFAEQNPVVIELAVNLVGRIKTMGMHAGAIIIADRPLYGSLPLFARGSHKKDDVDGEKQWVSMWTEGRSTQLSKFGFIKWDILGLKNLQYIKRCCELVFENRGIYFGDNLSGWDDTDPLDNKAGWYQQREGDDWIRDENGDPFKFTIPLDDAGALNLANKSMTDAVFQFDTPLAKQILGNGVRNFGDLMFFNAMGHPGPMECVAPDSKIETAVGQIAIKDLRGEPILYASTSGLSHTSNYGVYKSGVKKLYEVELSNGKRIKVTANHRFLTKSGYKKLSELGPGDEVLTDDDF